MVPAVLFKIVDFEREVKESMSEKLQTGEFPNNPSKIWKGILACIGTLLLGAVIYLIIGGILSGIGVSMLATGIIAAVLFLPVAITIIADWPRLHGVYTCGDDRQILRLSKWERLAYKAMTRILGIPKSLKRAGAKIGSAFANAGKRIGSECKDIVTTFINGDWKTKVSYLVMGFGCLARGQILRGLLFLLFEIVFIGYMILEGGKWIGMLPSLGLQGPETVKSTEYDSFYTIYHDNSFRILLYGVLTIFFIIAFIYTWRMNVKQNKLAEQILASGKKLKREG